MSVRFGPAIIKFALDEFVPTHSKDRLSRRGPQRYPFAVYYTL
jgi:hypothetical protein